MSQELYGAVGSHFPPGSATECVVVVPCVVLQLFEFSLAEINTSTAGGVGGSVVQGQSGSTTYVLLYSTTVNTKYESGTLLYSHTAVYYLQYSTILWRGKQKKE